MPKKTDFIRQLPMDNIPIFSKTFPDEMSKLASAIDQLSSEVITEGEVIDKVIEIHDKILTHPTQGFDLDKSAEKATFLAITSKIVPKEKMPWDE